MNFSSRTTDELVQQGPAPAHLQTRQGCAGPPSISPPPQPGLRFLRAKSSALQTNARQDCSHDLVDPSPCDKSACDRSLEARTICPIAYVLRSASRESADRNGQRQ